MIRKNYTFNYTDSPIISCEFLIWNYNTNENNDCIIQQIWTPEYSDCYKITVHSSESTNIREFAALIYVNTSLERATYSFMLDISTTQSREVQILAHARGTKPDESWYKCEYWFSNNNGTEANQTNQTPGTILRLYSSGNTWTRRWVNNLHRIILITCLYSTTVLKRMWMYYKLLSIYVQSDERI